MAEDIKTQWTEQVSLIIRHAVRPDQHAAYEEWLKIIIVEAGKFPGHMGTHVMRPGEGRDDYEISVRFASREDAERWIRSDERKALVRRLEPIITRHEQLNIKTGIDYWFTAATENHLPPPAWKQFTVTTLVIWPLTVLIPWLLGLSLFRWLPWLGVNGVAQLVVAVFVVGLVTWVVMPPLARALSGWLSR